LSHRISDGPLTRSSLAEAFQDGVAISVNAVLAEFALADQLDINQFDPHNAAQHGVDVVRRRIGDLPGRRQIMFEVISEGRHHLTLPLGIIMGDEPTTHLHGLVVPRRYDLARLRLGWIPARRYVGIRPAEDRQGCSFMTPDRVWASEVADQRCPSDDQRHRRSYKSVWSGHHELGERVCSHDGQRIRFSCGESSRKIHHLKTYAAVMSDAAPFRQVVTADELRVLYRQPSQLVQSKVFDRLDAASTAFVQLSPFVLVGTGGDDGFDVSPRGGVPGFVKVLDDQRLALPDMPGNNLLDTISNVMRTGRIGLLFVVPGKDETVRINGRAWLVTDDEVLDLFVDEVKRPKAAIGIQIEQVFIHCAKAFRRSHLWEPESWASMSDAPDACDMLVSQGLTGDLPVETLREMFEAGYIQELAAESPESPDSSE
jgi:uncharacterized protein